jgi:hypothetical protein
MKPQSSTTTSRRIEFGGVESYASTSEVKALARAALDDFQ